MIHTDASHRFERGADFAAAPLANTLVTKHILEVMRGERLKAIWWDIIVDRRRGRDGRAGLRSGLSIAEVRRHLGVNRCPGGHHT